MLIPARKTKPALFVMLFLVAVQPIAGAANCHRLCQWIQMQPVIVLNACEP